MDHEGAKFDNLSVRYEELLADPIRDRFTGAASEFFHTRKRDLIRAYFRNRGVDTRSLTYLDVGCGKGELLKLLRSDFGQVCGCDPSKGMLEAGKLEQSGIATRVQSDPGKLPYEAESFDFVTAVCVYHHIPPPARAGVTAEIRRVLKPGGVFAMIEHNPYNPATRLIVSRTPVDADAILLTIRESRSLMRDAGLRVDGSEYFLYLPEKLYRHAAWVESALRRFPLGGQYAVFGLKD